jgi:hypothetical protein
MLSLLSLPAKLILPYLAGVESTCSSLDFASKVATKIEPPSLRLNAIYYQYFFKHVVEQNYSSSKVQWCCYSIIDLHGEWITVNVASAIVIIVALLCYGSTSVTRQINWLILKQKQLN